MARVAAEVPPDIVGPVPHVAIDTAAHVAAWEHARDLSDRRVRGTGRTLRRALTRRLDAIMADIAAADPKAVRSSGHAQWLLDNSHVLREALTQIEVNLPRHFYRQLPAVARVPRILRVADAAIAACELPLDLRWLEGFLDAYQDETLLTIGELWALPTMLRAVLLRYLCDAAETANAVTAEDREPREFEAEPTAIVAACVTALRGIAACSWNDFFERVSRVERGLREDPVYVSMDAQSRDLYRGAVEKTALRRRVSEWQVVRAACELARVAERGPCNERFAHVGYYLIGAGRLDLNLRLGMRLTLAWPINGFLRRQREWLYVLATVGLGAVLCGVFALWMLQVGAAAAFVWTVSLLATIPALKVSQDIIGSVVCHTLPPKILPKLDFSSGIDRKCQSLVVVPALLTSPTDIDEILRTLEHNYLANPDASLRFIALTDYCDADRAELPEDEALLDYARAGIDLLNARHGDKRQPFGLLNRRRLWNENAQVWMGWERKRGKLGELNEMLRGAHDTSYVDFHGAVDDLEGTHFVITLDADTFLPAGAAARLIGTLAHPLNRAVIDKQSRRVIHGYSVLQPRVEINPVTGTTTSFARVFAGDATLDLYSRAVSDMYQDLFGAGIFAGKGIYDVDAFEATLAGRIPANRILSHDLLEGLHGRAGLVSDIIVLEDYPQNLLAYLHRMHRWIRGDWQLLPWLTGGIRHTTGQSFHPGVVGYWKIFDNMRRSLLGPVMVAILALGWLGLPQLAGVWTLAVVVAVASGSIVAGVAALRVRAIRWGTPWSSLRGVAHAARTEIVRLLCILAYLPMFASTALDAIVRTLYRVKITRRRLLEWSTAANIARATSQTDRAVTYALRLWALPATAVGSFGVLLFFAPAALPAAGFLLLLWFFAPLIAFWQSRVAAPAAPELAAADRAYLRRLARKTWRFFEQYNGPQTHWLPPDNVQLEPNPAIAERTSPTNIGLALMATLAAADLGFGGVRQTVLTLRYSLDSICALPKHRGHLYNWYSLGDKTPLIPRYVSTVDSGNLVAALIVLREGLQDLVSSPLAPVRLMDALRADLDTLCDDCNRVARSDANSTMRLLSEALGALLEQWQQSARPPVLLRHASGERLRELEKLALVALEESNADLEESDYARLRGGVIEFVRDVSTARDDLETFVPWTQGVLPEFSDCMSRNDRTRLTEALAAPVSVQELPDRICSVRAMLLAIPRIERRADRAYDRFCAQLDAAQTHALQLLSQIDAMRAQIRALIAATDFRFLYDADRHLFHVGYQVDQGELDLSYYDLLASEARLTSFLCIAKGDVPARHWMHLGRPLTSVRGARLLLSWSATAFEYLMPRLIMRTPDFGLIEQSCRGAVRQQQRFGRRHHIPWGVSESGYYRLDQQGQYQYQAFGIPRLGLKWGQGERLVVAAYASLLALPYDPQGVVENVRRMEELGGAGELGLFEALDFGQTSRHEAAAPRIVRSYMAHHQGMILIALANFLTGDRMLERFHRDAQIASLEYLLHERLPRRAQTHPLDGPPTPHRSHTAVGTAVANWHVDPRKRAIALLANDHLSARISNSGASGLHWQGLEVTRWRTAQDGSSGGSALYVCKPDHQRVWRVGEPASNTECQSIFAPHAVEFREHHGSLLVRTQICLATHADVELRKLSITNNSDAAQKVLVCAYSEPVLTAAAGDVRHPAFSKLFIKSAWLPERQALIFERRPRDGGETPLVMAQTVFAQPGCVASSRFETDRRVFLGRNGDRSTPAALAARTPRLSCTAGATLDPVCALAISVEVPAGASVQIAFVTAVGVKAAGVLDALEHFSSFERIDWSFNEARMRADRILQRRQETSEDVALADDLLGACLWPTQRPFRHADAISRAHQVQSNFWRHAVSGDRPVLVSVLRSEEDLPPIEKFLRVLAHWQRGGFGADLIVLDESASGYAQPTQDRLRALIAEILDPLAAGITPSAAVIVPVKRLETGEREALIAGARLFFDPDENSWPVWLATITRPPADSPVFIPLPSAPIVRVPIDTVPRTADEALVGAHDLGGVRKADGVCEIYLEAGQHTPAPWCNVLANPNFGTLVSESGQVCTWMGNSSENALTPWSNDAVLDTGGEALYIRDEETGTFWSPSPGPARNTRAYRVRHDFGTTQYAHNSEGLEQRCTVSVDPRDAVKYIHLRLRNRWPRTRRFTLTYAARWQLGSPASGPPHLVVPERCSAPDVLLARNAFARSGDDMHAFLTASLPAHGMTTDGDEFLGRNVSWAHPAGIAAVGLSGRIGPSDMPMAVYQVHINLEAGEESEMHFALGAGASRAAAIGLAKRARGPGVAAGNHARVREQWRARFESLQIRTPDAGLDTLVNHWLLYQTISSRLWGRLGFYQAAGGFGFRDQLQDSLALLASDPATTRSQILKAAAVQFEAGDVLHWWHDNPLRGVRTRCSDDLLWLPYVVSEYIAVTGDRDVLQQTVPYLDAPLLAEGESERYAEVGPGSDSGSLYQHCCRALDARMIRGSHGLPLMGTGDWNDGMNRVGQEGRGESVWLAWFLIDVCRRFAPLCDAQDDPVRAQHYRAVAGELAKTVEAVAWGGDWYLRGFYDDGAPLGAPGNRDARIDLNAQTWAVMTGCDEPRGRAALAAVAEHLEDAEHGLIRLLAPPFAHDAQEPGYIKAYPPGVRENGGQYNHAAVWAVWAAATAGDAKLAMRWLQYLNPLRRCQDTAALERYRLEPYVMAGDIYGAPPFTGRGGWSWYSGSAAWLYRCIVEKILGIELRAGRLTVNPCLPSDWPEYSVTIRHGLAAYHLRVHRPAEIASSRPVFIEHGEELAKDSLSLAQDGEHHLDVVPVSTLSVSDDGALLHSAGGFFR